MADDWPVFVIAEDAPLKALHRALLLIQDFEFTTYPEQRRWVLLTSKTLPSSTPGPTALPITDIKDNEYAGMSLDDVHDFARANEGTLDALGLSGNVWLVIDQKGLETSTCLVCERVFDTTERPENPDEYVGFTDAFRACRAPYEDAWGMMSNLSISNMDFEDYVDEEAGVQGDGTWRWSFSERVADEEVDGKREKALKELQDGGYAD